MSIRRSAGASFRWLIRWLFSHKFQVTELPSDDDKTTDAGSGDVTTFAAYLPFACLYFISCLPPQGGWQVKNIEVSANRKVAVSACTINLSLFFWYFAFVKIKVDAPSVPFCGCVGVVGGSSVEEVKIVLVENNDGVVVVLFGFCEPENIAGYTAEDQDASGPSSLETQKNAPPFSGCTERSSVMISAASAPPMLDPVTEQAEMQKPKTTFVASPENMPSAMLP
mmetsp:Transcript_3303/g.8551  ORF Transcript_3303/g.8551 Transcript_3303/m.8551 type:complete len:224 (+) Transcript_3303:488-1159(+)